MSSSFGSRASFPDRMPFATLFRPASICFSSALDRTPARARACACAIEPAMSCFQSLRSKWTEDVKSRTASFADGDRFLDDRGLVRCSVAVPPRLDHACDLQRQPPHVDEPLSGRG